MSRMSKMLGGSPPPPLSKEPLRQQPVPGMPAPSRAPVAPSNDKP